MSGSTYPNMARRPTIEVTGLKKIEAIIRQERLEKVKSALDIAGFAPMTLYDVMGRGEQRGVTLQFRGRSIQVDLLPKVKVEIVVEDENVDRVIETIVTASRTGKVGDGKIFVIPVERCLSVRTANIAEEKQKQY
jgi:nitrogen regulatory protein P-II 1